MGNAGVFDSAELGAEADVFLRAPLILLPPPNHPRAPFWRPVQVSEQLRRPPPPPPPYPTSSPLLPACRPPTLLPSRRLGLQPLLRVPNRGAALPCQPFSSHSNLSYQGTSSWGSRAGPASHLQHVASAPNAGGIKTFCVSPEREFGTPMKDRNPVLILRYFSFVFFFYYSSSVILTSLAFS